MSLSQNNFADGIKVSVVKCWHYPRNASDMIKATHLILDNILFIPLAELKTFRGRHNQMVCLDLASILAVKHRPHFDYVRQAALRHLYNIPVPSLGLADFPLLPSRSISPSIESDTAQTCVFPPSHTGSNTSSDYMAIQDLPGGATWKEGMEMENREIQEHASGLLIAGDETSLDFVALCAKLLLSRV